MKVIFDIAFLIYGLFYLPILLFRNKIHSGLKERLGILPSTLTSFDKTIWIHGVSVGEVVLADKLLRRIKKDFKNSRVLISTTTVTGNNMALLRSRGVCDGIFYFPLDLSFIVRNVIKSIKPVLFIAIETELWPNLLYELRSANIPSILVNGRVSDRAFRGYKVFSFIVKKIIRKLSFCAMQSQRSAERIKDLGVPSDRIKITGNIKFDDVMGDRGRHIFEKERLGISLCDRVLLAGSTHYPEEHYIIDIFDELYKEIEGISLIIAPRHIERTEAIEVYLKKKGIGYNRLSDILENGAVETLKKAKVLLVNTIGHLKDLYSLATVVFIGGSLVKRGGQNPIEAAMAGSAVIFGPNMSNFREIMDIFMETNAAITVKNTQELKKKLKMLLFNENKRKELSSNAFALLESNKGAIDKTMDIIRPFIEKSI